ncbi:MAG: DUF2182 domain-containing protein [Thermomicrobiales bacterium]
MALARRETARPEASLVWLVVIAAWGLTATLFLVGRADLVSHDALLATGTLPTIGNLILFLATWQLMTGAMMLPSSAPMVGLFARVSRSQARPRLALGTFLAGYFVVWTGFAGAALAADAGLHALAERWAWLDAQPALITGVVLLVAGAFQFSSLKERCLDACRTPMSFLWRFYGRGTRRAGALGLRHGLFCLGCCWALMLVMFAVGVGNLFWMAALTGVMAIEKTVSWGRKLAPVVGAGLIAWGVVVLGFGEAMAHAGEDHGESGERLLPGVAAVAAMTIAALVVWARHRADDADGRADQRPSDRPLDRQA